MSEVERTIKHFQVLAVKRQEKLVLRWGERQVKILLDHLERER